MRSARVRLVTYNCGHLRSACPTATSRLLAVLRSGGEVAVYLQEL